MSSVDGARARAIRLETGLGVEELAAATGLSPNTIRATESGRHQPRPRVALALAAGLGVTLDDLAAAPDGEPTLCDIRHRLGLTQAEMAKRIGVGRQMVSRVERGVGGVRSPHAWAMAYQLTLAQWERAHEASRDLVRRKVAARAHVRKKRGESG